MSETQKLTSSRLVSMDFVRVLALLGVILFHAAGAYSLYTPYWSVHDGASMVATSIRELVDVFIMPLFFFVAGYFALSSLSKRGIWGFFKRKFWELGFVWIVVVVLVLPFTWWALNRDTATSYLTIWSSWLQSIGQTRLGVFENPSQSLHMHFWFISLLFAFFIAFLSIYKIAGTFAVKHSTVEKKGSSNKKTALALLTFGALCTVGYFVSLLLVPDTSWLTINLILQFQPSKLFIFAACFGLGIYGYSKNWFIDGKQIGRLSIWTPATILLSTAFMVIGQDVFQNPLTTTTISPAYLLLYASVRSILLLAIIVTVCSLAVRYFNRPSRTISAIADNSYYIYLLHLFFVSIFQDILMIWSGPIAIKIALVFVISLTISYAVSRWIFKKTSRWKGLIVLTIISFVLPVAATLL